MWKSLLSRQLVRNVRSSRIHTSAVVRIREITVVKKDKSTIIEGKVLPSPRTNLLKLDERRSKACPLCRLGLDVKHTDVLILSQFTDSTGNILPMEATGLCKKQHEKVEILIAMANSTDLMPGNISGNEDKWKEFHTYYDESLIQLPIVPRRQKDKRITNFENWTPKKYA